MALPVSSDRKLLELKKQQPESALLWDVTGKKEESQSTKPTQSREVA
jgi:hypothetical protein